MTTKICENCPAFSSDDYGFWCGFGFKLSENKNKTVSHECRLEFFKVDGEEIYPEIDFSGDETK